MQAEASLVIVSGVLASRKFLTRSVGFALLDSVAAMEMFPFLAKG